MDTVEEYVREWLKRERHYTIDKFGLEADSQHTIQFSRGSTEWWDTQLSNYYGRAQVLGLDIPNGRQALAKFVATAVGMLEATVRQFGELPEPGVTSGENLDKLMELPDGYS